jgi:hypothetical protein
MVDHEETVSATTQSIHVREIRSYVANDALVLRKYRTSDPKMHNTCITSGNTIPAERLALDSVKARRGRERDRVTKPEFPEQFWKT